MQPPGRNHPQLWGDERRSHHTGRQRPPDHHRCQGRIGHRPLSAGTPGSAPQESASPSRLPSVLTVIGERLSQPFVYPGSNISLAPVSASYTPPISAAAALARSRTPTLPQTQPGTRTSSSSHSCLTPTTSTQTPVGLPQHRAPGRRDRRAGARPQRKRITPPHPVAPAQRSSGDHRRNKREGTRDVRHGLGASLLYMTPVPLPLPGRRRHVQSGSCLCVLRPVRLVSAPAPHKAQYGHDH